MKYTSKVYEIVDKFQNVIYVGRSINPERRFKCFSLKHPKLAFGYEKTKKKLSELAKNQWKNKTLRSSV